MEKKLGRLWIYLQAIFLIILFFASVIWQGSKAWEFLYYLWIGRVPRIAETNAIERTAISSFDDDVYLAVKFLRSEIPDQAVVVILPYNEDFPLRYKTMAQYFLFPRTIVRCNSVTTKECPEIENPNTYIVFYADVPPKELLPEHILIMNNEQVGYYRHR